MFRRFALALALTAPTLAACSGNEDTPANTQPGTDAASDVAAETTPDTATDTAPPGPDAPFTCEQTLPSGFTCAEPRKAVGKTTCTEADLESFVTTCITADFEVPAACADWKTAHPQCAACVEDWSFDDAKVFPDDWQCYDALIPGCGKALNCDFDCQDKACGECDFTPDSSGGSEGTDCIDKVSSTGGQCFALASEQAKACTSNPTGKPCEITQYYVASADQAKLRDEVLRVIRGACRDGADWSKAGEAGDAGTSDAATDATSDAADDAASDAAAD